MLGTGLLKNSGWSRAGSRAVTIRLKPYPDTNPIVFGND